MKFLAAQVIAFAEGRSTRRNLRALARYVGLLAVIVALYSTVFHVLMEAEGQQHSWITGVYWTLTVMSTLGFGDITFESDLGRAFSMLVLVSGVVFLLIVLPFTFIHFFYQPWLEARDRKRAPRALPEGTRDHVILIGSDPVVRALAERLAALGRPYALLVAEVPKALELFDEGVQVAVGKLDDVETWERMRVEDAAMVLAAADDFVNTSVAFTVRERSERVPIVSLARSGDSVDVLELAGSSHVLQLPELLGASLARRAYTGSSRANVVGAIEGLSIAEAPATHSVLVGRTLAESGIAENSGATVLGVWEKGAFQLPHATTVITNDTVLVLVGTDAHLARFDSLAQAPRPDTGPVLILGGGRVGRVVARQLAARGLDFRVVEQDVSRRPAGADPAHWVIGSAADLATLERARVSEAPAVVITTRDDATNIYLTLYCRRLRPDVHIVARANLDRNVSTLHRAGANLVMSYASLGASTILGLAEHASVVHVAEGLEIFRWSVPRALVGRTLAESRLREETDCNVLLIEREGERILAPKASLRMRRDDRLVLAGPPEGRRSLRSRFRR